MRTCLIASNNLNKLKEIQTIMSDFQCISMSDMGCNADIPETGNTFQENAELKASFLHKLYPGYFVFADDSGLEVTALDGQPGVYSARYAGTPSNPQKNNEKLLDELNIFTNRHARFVTVICLKTPKGETYFFTGEIEGEISPKLSGYGGFGYDPLFIPKGHHQTFAEMTPSQKNQLSHRAKALSSLKTFLTSQEGWNRF